MRLPQLHSRCCLAADYSTPARNPPVGRQKKQYYDLFARVGGGSRDKTIYCWTQHQMTLPDEAEIADDAAVSYVFYPEHQWSAALAGIVVSIGCLLGLTHGAVGGQGAVSLQTLALIIGIVLGGLAVIQACSRYPRLLLTPYTLTEVSLLGSTTVQLEEMGIARVFRRRHRFQTSIYLGFLTRTEEAALSQDSTQGPVKWSDMSQLIYLGAFIDNDMGAAKSIADGVNMIRVRQQRLDLDAHTVQLHLSRLKKRRFWFIAVLVALVIGLLLLKSL